jgi:hypothetical protein
MCAKWDLERPQHGEMTTQRSSWRTRVAGVAEDIRISCGYPVAKRYFIEHQKIPEGFLV